MVINMYHIGIAGPILGRNQMGFDKKSNILETFPDFTTALNTTSDSIRVQKGEILSQDFHINKQQAGDPQEGTRTRSRSPKVTSDCRLRVSI